VPELDGQIAGVWKVLPLIVIFKGSGRPDWWSIHAHILFGVRRVGAVEATSGFGGDGGVGLGGCGFLV